MGWASCWARWWNRAWRSRPPPSWPRSWTGWTSTGTGCCARTRSPAPPVSAGRSRSPTGPAWAWFPPRAPRNPAPPPAGRPRAGAPAAGVDDPPPPRLPDRGVVGRGRPARHPRAARSPDARRPLPGVDADLPAVRDAVALDALGRGDGQHGLDRQPGGARDLGSGSLDVDRLRQHADRGAVRAEETVGARGVQRLAERHHHVAGRAGVRAARRTPGRARERRPGAGGRGRRRGARRPGAGAVRDPPAGAPRAGGGGGRLVPRGR